MARSNRFKSGFYGVTAILVAGAVGFFALAPAIVERSMNIVEGGAFDLSDTARQRHAALVVADLHADSLLWHRDLLTRSTRGHVDIPRLIEGNVGLQVFTTVTKTPAGLNNVENAADARDNITLLAVAQRWPLDTWTSLTARAFHQSKRLHDFARRSEGKLRIIKTKADLEKLLRDRSSGVATVGALLGTEGSHALDGNIENVELLFNAGFRMMSLQHFFDNRLGGSLHGTAKSGLTEFGRKVVKEIEQRNIMLDVSHSSEQVITDVMAITDKPLIVSHTGTHGHCGTPRNISDDLMQSIANAGGLIGIGFWDSAVCDISPTGIAKAIVAAVALLGADHVALGSDFDGAVTTAFDVSNLALLTQALIEQGVGETTIRKVMGQNQVDFFRDQLPD